MHHCKPEINYKNSNDSGNTQKIPSRKERKKTMLMLYTASLALEFRKYTTSN